MLHTRDDTPLHLDRGVGCRNGKLQPFPVQDCDSPGGHHYHSGTANAAPLRLEPRRRSLPRGRSHPCDAGGAHCRPAGLEDPWRSDECL